ncbi:hypothetical protein Esti_002306 [Eimeria stiedai]
MASNLSDDDVIEVGHPCRFSEVEMRTPRARRQSPSEPRTPSKGPSSAKTSRLGSPLVTPKLDRRKVKYRSLPAAVLGKPQPTFAQEEQKIAIDKFPSPGFSQEVLNSSADAVRIGNSTLRWCSTEADEDEQLLRRFDLEAMYGPSVGLSRTERWKRASMMGLCPPAEVLAALERNPHRNLSLFDQRLNPDMRHGVY